MTKKRKIITLTSNTIFLSFAVFLFSFIWLNFYIKKFSLSLLVSLIITIIFAVIFIYINYKKDIKSKYKDELNTFYEYTKLQLIYGKYDLINNFILSLYNIKNYKKITDNHYQTNSKDVFIMFEKEEILKDDFLKIIKASQLNNILIFCIKCTQKANLNSINCNVYNFDDIFNKMKSENKLIDLKIELQENKKLSLKEIFQHVFNKKYSKKFFFLSVLLTISSIFTPYTIYYLICSSLVLLLSIYCRFNKKYN